MSSHRPQVVLLLAVGSLAALQAPEPPSATVQVTATRFSEDPIKVPGSVTVITGKELEDRGATDLRSALALAAGRSAGPSVRNARRSERGQS
jgi:outer membrane receptor protein involved in Fe transport